MLKIKLDDDWVTKAWLKLYPTPQNTLEASIRGYFRDVGGFEIIPVRDFPALATGRRLHPRDRRHPDHDKWLRTLAEKNRAPWAGLTAEERKAKHAAQRRKKTPPRRK